MLKKKKKKAGGEFRHTVNAETQNRKFSYGLCFFVIYCMFFFPLPSNRQERVLKYFSLSWF